MDATGVVDTVLQASKVELPGAKMVIGTGGASDTTPGILVLKDTNKAMVLPKVASPHLNIINPSAGMMVYDTVKHQLAVFNGRYGLSGNLCNSNNFSGGLLCRAFFILDIKYKLVLSLKAHI
uniref:Uncharacterized protein n=1 Tax=Chryseobacterium endophyticum TaxID=1854762 RepID=A0AAU6WRA1_9FLAO